VKFSLPQSQINHPWVDVDDNFIEITYSSDYRPSPAMGEILVNTFSIA